MKRDTTESPIIFIFVLCFTQGCSGLSSLVYTYNRNHKLNGNFMKRLQTQTVIDCAHRCLQISLCGGYNYRPHEVAHHRGTCELVGRLDKKEGGLSLYKKDGWNNGRMISKERAFTFTHLGASGRDGPITTLEYLGTSLEGHVKLNKGIQLWTVPQTGNYIIEAWGASGGNGTNNTLPRMWRVGGLGARIQGVFFLNRGQSLKILVGQEGQPVMDYNPNPGSGGGGSFVTLTDNTPLIVAGGGGGGSSPAAGWLDGDDGQISCNGSSYGGAGGKGGGLKKPYDAVLTCGAGGGLTTDGRGTFISSGGHSYITGGLGGLNQPSPKGNGGFGGGGASNSDPGAGGGYSGGGVLKTESSMIAGGGGSYNGGEMKNDEAGVNKGHGKVVITIMGD